MEIDRIYNKGKGKGKGKDKGKDKGKGKQKSGSNSKGYYQKGGKSKDGKGKGKSKQSAEGKGKGQGQQRTQAVCYSCGKTGHMARDCWARDVRQVQFEEQPQQQPSQQANSGNINSQVGAAGSSQGANPANQQRVRRAQMWSDDETFNSVIHDLTAEDEEIVLEPCAFVNMIQVSCEEAEKPQYFCIDIACDNTMEQPQDLLTFDLTDQHALSDSIW